MFQKEVLTSTEKGFRLNDFQILEKEKINTPGGGLNIVK